MPAASMRSDNAFRFKRSAFYMGLKSKARVSEEAVRRKGGEGGPRKLGMGYGEAEEPV